MIANERNGFSLSPWHTFVVLLLLNLVANLVLPVSSFSPNQRRVHSGSSLFSMEDGASSDAQPLSLSPDDLRRFDQMKSRQRKVPTMMMKKILLPGESMTFGSDHMKFNIMMDAVESEGLALLGTDEGNTMAYGVTTKVQELSSANDGYTSIQIKGDEVFEVVDSPFLDSTESFYYCNIDVVDDGEDLEGIRLEEATKMYNQIPDLVELLTQRIGVMLGSSSLEKTNKVVERSGEMPDLFSERAFWVAGLLNRVDTGVTPTNDIRPRILAAKSDFERLRLAWSALNEAIDSLAKS